MTAEYIQDIVTFLKNKDLEEDVKYEHRKNTRRIEASVEEDEWKQHVDTERSCPATFSNSWLPTVFDARQRWVEETNR